MAKRKRFQKAHNEEMVYFHCSCCLQAAKKDLEVLGYHPRWLGSSLFFSRKEARGALEYLANNSNMSQLESETCQNHQS